LSKRKKGRKRRHRQSRNKNQNKSKKRSNSYYEERPETDKERGFKSQRRRQDLMFVAVMIIVGVSLISGYYLYETTWGPGNNNNNGTNGNNDLIENGNGDQKDNNVIVWEHDYEKGLELARNSDKPILIDFYTEWCVYCKDMDRDTYSNSNVIQKSTEFVCIKVDGDNRPDVRENYFIDSYPTTVFLNVNQVETHRMKGYIGPGPFLEDMDFALERAWI
jgi:thiol:disulfide interchange protein DsbD